MDTKNSEEDESPKNLKTQKNDHKMINDIKMTYINAQMNSKRIQISN
jgi:hypothetical protein